MALKFDLDLEFVTLKVTRGKIRETCGICENSNRMMRMSKEIIEDQVTHVYGMFAVRKCGKFRQNWRFCVKKC